MRNEHRYRWLSGEYGKWLLIALLTLAFPVGLYIMWTECGWKKSVKTAVTALWGVIILTALAVMILGPWSYDYSGMNPNVLTTNTKMLAPLPPAELTDTTQLIRSVSEDSALISEPTPTPVPTRVYCNDNGKYYHLTGCRYVYPTTPKVTLNQAKNAGKTACPLCNPPKEETYGS